LVGLETALSAREAELAELAAEGLRTATRRVSSGEREMSYRVTDDGPARR
jgi:hypothetical protein